jgi:hypothetical protein
MRAEDLFVLATAHGVDLVRAAGQSAPALRHGARRRRCADGQSYVELDPHSAQTARGRSTHVTRRPTWSTEVLAQAAAGVPDIPFKAACYAFAGDRDSYWPLWSALAREAQELRVRHEWPAQVKGLDGARRFYVEALAALVLDADEHQPLFTAAPTLYALCLQIDESTWRRGVRERFDRLRRRFDGWIVEAMSIMQPRLDELAGEE